MCQSLLSTVNTTWSINDLPEEVTFPAYQQTQEFSVNTTSPFWRVTIDSSGWVLPNSYSFSKQSRLSLLTKASLHSVPRRTKLKIWEGNTLKKEMLIIQLANDKTLDIPSEFHQEFDPHISPTYIEEGETYVYFDKERSGLLDIQLIDLSGNIVWEQQLSVQGKKQVYLSLPSVGMGYYILRTRIKGETRVTKIFMQ